MNAHNHRRPLISVVVCTYNRAELLRDVIQDICNQTLDRSLYEIVVVDNNSTDHTRDTIEVFQAKHCIHYVREQQQGLAYARNRGWQEARGTYVAYTDDDCRIPTDWLDIAYNVIRTHNPRVFGGPYHPFYLSPKPAWFKDEYGAHEEGHAIRAISLAHGEELTGANLCIERKLLSELGGFDTTLGMRGHEIGYGEETDLQWRIHTDKPEVEVVYVPELEVYHLVPPHKMTLHWYIRQRFCSGRDSSWIYRKRDASERHALRAAVTAVYCLGRLLLGTVYGLCFRNRDAYPYAQNYYRESDFSYYIHRLGYQTGVLRQLLQEATSQPRTNQADAPRVVSK